MGLCPSKTSSSNQGSVINDKTGSSHSSSAEGGASAGKGGTVNGASQIPPVRDSALENSASLTKIKDAAKPRGSGGGTRPARHSQDAAPAGQQPARQTQRSEDRGSVASSTGGAGKSDFRITSTRSSFAVDVAPQHGARTVSMDVGGTRSAVSKQTHARLQQAPCGNGTSLELYKPSPALVDSYRALGILAPDMPAPVGMLAHLWKVPEQEALLRAQQFRDAGVMRIAQLDDGSFWCLVTPDHLARAQAQLDAQDEVMEAHKQLLDAYTRHGDMAVKDVPDDGYIMQAMTHHLVGGERLTELHDLLAEPAWLEAKLHAYGVAPVVQDFRRYLAESEDADIKLLLQAFQLSLSCCMEHPTCKMLREQMLGRLVAVAHAAPPEAGEENSPLPVNSAKRSMSERGRSSNAAAALNLKAWFESQSTKVAADIGVAAGYHLVHLVPRSASLQQAGGLHRMTLRGHTATVPKVVISPNGSDVITVSDDGTAQVWDMNVGDCVMQLTRDTPLTCVAVAPGGAQACVSSADGHCCIWELSSGKVAHVLKGHTAKVNSVVIDRQGLRCITASDDGSARVWDMRTGACEQVLQGHGQKNGGGRAGVYGKIFDVAVSSDGTLAATVSEDFTARVWDLDEEEECAHVLEGHSGWVMSVAFIGASSSLVTASHDGTARVWDGDTGRCLHVLAGHTGRLNRVTVDPGGTYAVTCSDDNTARVWDLDTGECLSVLQGHQAWVADALIMRDGKRAVTVGADGLGYVWNVATGKAEVVLEGHSAPIRSVVTTGRGRFVVTASEDNTARVWDLQAAAEGVIQSQAHGGRIKQVGVLPGGRQVVSAGDDGQLFVWDAATARMVQAMKGSHAAGISYLGTPRDSRSREGPGARNLVMTGSSDRRVCAWDPATGELVYELAAQQGSRVKDVAFCTASARAAIVLFDSSVAVWDLAKGTVIAQLMGRGERVVRNVHSGGVNGVLLSAGGATAITWSKDCTARVWDVGTNSVKFVVSGHTDGLRCAALSHDETMLATASYAPCVRIHRMEDGAPLAVLDHEAPAVDLLFSKDGHYLAVVLDNYQVVVWDLVAHSCLPPLAAHKADILSSAFSPDCTMLATCSQDCTVRVWDCTSGRQLAFFMADAALSSLCFAGAPYPDILVAGDAGGGLHFLNLPNELLPETAPRY